MVDDLVSAEIHDHTYQKPTEEIKPIFSPWNFLLGVFTEADNHENAWSIVPYPV